MIDLFTDTRREAREAMAERLPQLRRRCLAELQLSGAHGRTADEVAMILNETVLAVRPRFTELLHARLIVDTGRRHMNESGRSARVWKAAQ